ncbi:ankyrin repeat domain-containing protein [Mucilaginibacter ginsenosidivorax]|uniref:Ankyrin repeat domain-containing protein n=1 Tax=Mucilaginibacter ginsenosidivorax TaxID=862126 RepID=A0A5B8W2I9_9SPHI|nr:ankyrin repeat domain-containing protein [Mucilaginibacter ginsenosidivorax]QEC78280.1 ankyrin repeat domain-containing protein [Mucilaginibacter ginsenosidivorax]
MKNADITNPLFRQAVEAIENGDIGLLTILIAENRQLVQDKLDLPEPGYFQDPYLLWFVADNPIRNSTLPPNIADVTQLLVGFVKEFAAGTMQHQLDYALGLVATGRIPRECGVQIALMDVLIDAGAKPGGGLGALAHGNFDAASHLIKRGGKLTLAAAIGLDRMDDVIRFTAGADKAELLVALTVAGFYGKPHMVTYLLNLGADPNGYPENNKGFHSHATPLHQAVYSGSLECVKLLVEAGARLDMPDKVYNGTPLGWALHMQNDESPNEEARKNFAEIAEYLRR